MNNEKGTGHDWEIRKSDALAFCKKCGWWTFTGLLFDGTGHRKDPGPDFPLATPDDLALTCEEYQVWMINRN